MDWRLWAAGAFLLLAAIGVRQTSERSGATSQRAQPLPLRTTVLERQQQPTTESSAPTHEGEAAIGNLEPEIPADIDAHRFACRAQLAGLWANAASRTVPPGVLALLACDRMSEAVEQLLTLARSGDRGALSVLASLWLFCSRDPTPEAQASWDRAIDGAREAGAPVRVQERLSAIVAARKQSATSPDRRMACARLRSPEVARAVAPGRARVDSERLRRPGRRSRARYGAHPCGQWQRH
jgi:hypothetical protein